MSHAWVDGGWKSSLVLVPTLQVDYDRDLPVVMQQQLQDLPLVWPKPVSFKILEYFRPLKQPPCRQAAEVWDWFCSVMHSRVLAGFYAHGFVAATNDGSHDRTCVSSSLVFFVGCCKQSPTHRLRGSVSAPSARRASFLTRAPQVAF